MAKFKLSRRAAADLDVIAEYSIDRFGVEQARQYRDELKDCFESLAANPQIGRRAEQLTKGLRRFEHGSHIIFYLPNDDGIFVVRLLHYRMDAGRRF